MSRIRSLGAALLTVVLVGPAARTEAGFVAVGEPLKGSQALLSAGSSAPLMIDDFALILSLAAKTNGSGDNIASVRDAYPLSLIDGIDLICAPAPVQSKIAPSVSVNFSPVGIMVANAA